MRMMTTFFAALIAISGSTAMAGNPEPAVMEVPLVLPVQTVEPQASSINSTFVVVGILAALLIAAAVSANDD